jgi:hypothetical protein
MNRKTPQIPDPDLERIRRETEQRLEQLERPASALIKDVTLADGVATPVPHRLGQPVSAFCSPPRGAVSTGRIEELRAGTHDRSKYVVLKATGWGATITVDVEARIA